MKKKKKTDEALKMFQSSYLLFNLNKCIKRILQNLPENACIGVSFLIKLQTSGLQRMKKETLIQVFFCEFCEIFKNAFFT